MNDELEKLKSLLYIGSLTQYGKRKLIKTYEDIIKEKDKQIEKLQNEKQLLNEFIYITGGKDIPKDTTATRYVTIQREGYFQGREEERKIARKYFNEIQEELKCKDKQIDLMVEYISNLDIDEDICKKVENNCDDFNKENKCIECVKQYFYNEVRGENNG